MSFCVEKEIKIFFKELLFYNASIEKPSIKRLNNIDMLRKLPFYYELSIVKTSKIKDSKDSSVQLRVSKY